MRRLAALAIAGVVLAGCGGTQSPGQALQLWSDASHLKEAAGTLLHDEAQVHDAITARRDARVIHTVCVELLNDAQGANDELPSSDPQLTGLLSDAYGKFVQAANRCYDAASDPAGLTRADRLRRAATVALVSSVLRAEAVLGHSLKVPGVP
jgi:hypothetical protein